jgi:hypothetical protein
MFVRRGCGWLPIRKNSFQTVSMMVDVSALDLDPMVRAQGIALAVVGSILERKGGLPTGEFSRLLGLIGAATAETDPEAGNLLGVWSAFSAPIAASNASNDSTH